MRLFLPSMVLIGFMSITAQAQTTVTGDPAKPGTSSAQPGGQNAVSRPNTDAMPQGNAQGAAASGKLEPGANSFTEGQVKSRLEEAGFKEVKDLKKDDQGIWHGKASQNGKAVNVGFDFKGNVSTQ